MALTTEYKGIFRYHEELQYGVYTSGISDTVCPGVNWKLQSIKIHCSVSFISSEDLLIYLSSHLGSAHNFELYRDRFRGAKDFYINFSEPLPFLSEDCIVISLSNSSDNIKGLVIDTWAARG